MSAPNIPGPPPNDPEVTSDAIPLPAIGHIYRADRSLPDGRITDTWLLLPFGLLHFHYHRPVPAHWVGAPFRLLPATRAAAMLEEDEVDEPEMEGEEREEQEERWGGPDAHDHYLWLLGEVYRFYVEWMFWSLVEESVEDDEEDLFYDDEELEF